MGKCTTSATPQLSRSPDVSKGGLKAAHDACAFYDISPGGWNPRENKMQRNSEEGLITEERDQIR